MFFKIGVLNLQVSRPATLLKKRPQYMFFLCEYHKIVHNSFYMEHLWWLLVKMVEELISNSTLERFVREKFI